MNRYSQLPARYFFTPIGLNLRDHERNRKENVDADARGTTANVEVLTSSRRGSSMTGHGSAEVDMTRASASTSCERCGVEIDGAQARVAVQEGPPIWCDGCIWETRHDTQVHSECANDEMHVHTDGTVHGKLPIAAFSTASTWDEFRRAITSHWRDE